MKIIRNSLLIILTIPVILLGIKFTSTNLRIEGYSGLVFEYLNPGHDTVFSDNYTDEGFLKIEKGMTEVEVIKILGIPLIRWIPKDNYLVLEYSGSKRSTHYRLRQVRLTNGIVNEIIGYYYID